MSETTTANNTATPVDQTSTKATTPVSADDPLAYKKRKLVRSPPKANPLKAKVWLAGHVAAIVFGSISFVFQLLWLPNYYYINSISYRLSLIGSMVALTATFSHKFGLHNLPSTATLLSHQNFQYLILAGIWIFTFKSVFKILPYFIIALLQLGTLKEISFITKESDFLASVIAYDELFLIVYLLLRTLFFRNASGYQLTVFLIFYWLRILYNKETTNLFETLIEKLDGHVSKIQNPKVQHYWYKTKTFIHEKQHEQLDEHDE
ncbi:hypothetical protein SBY92_004122 [Candida maltosa Xu316]|uniref:Uncharacterized protein n=1 Tax=Candida maltosa (strain Xu316) TaxID=1245528 RepID=M3K0J1_CANMX|nr:hypothetical protein G210_0565 [Candida maltosa Xu316]